MLWPDPAERDRWSRSATTSPPASPEAQREGWLGEVEGLQGSLAGATDKLAQIDRRNPGRNPGRNRTTVELGMPTVPLQSSPP
jgi:hypothetical protein